MIKPIKKKRKVTFSRRELGGMLGQMPEDPNALAGAGGGTGEAASSIASMISFDSLFGKDTQKNAMAQKLGGNERAKIGEGAKAVEKGLAMVPGWGTIASAALSFGRNLGEKTQDEYGVYKSKGAAVIDNALNPIQHFSAVKTTLQNPSAENILNFATLGLVGKSDLQKKAEEIRDAVQYKEKTDSIINDEEQGAKIRSSIPTFQAPAYGKKGLKFKSIFSKR